MMRFSIPFFLVYFLSLIRPLCGSTQERGCEEKTSASSTSSMRRATGCVGLECFDEWKAEEGYWIGDYSFYQADGTPFVSAQWNYPYNSYKGFITAALKCNKFRQRNVFLYPPQSEAICKETNDSTIGEGICGENGNSKVFFADQQQQDQDGPFEDNDGSIEGTYAGGLYTTKTTLVGDGTAVLYQVLDSNGKLHMNQLSSVTVSEEDGMRRRIRSAQAFTPQGHPMAMSYYREREVSEDDFYAELAATLIDYNILPSDTCSWMDYGPKPTNYSRGIDGCIEHLQEAFEIKRERCHGVAATLDDGGVETKKFNTEGGEALENSADSSKQQHENRLLRAASIYLPSVFLWVLE